jgi:predicted nucleotidyltransferase
MSPLSAQTLDALRRVAEPIPQLELLLLFGSRARGDAHPQSDWDFGYLAGEAMDPSGLLGAIVETIGTDRVDVVDLARASGLLRFRAARDGDVVYEATPRRAERFRLDAVLFWCDARPVLERGYAELLAELGG